MNALTTLAYVRAGYLANTRVNLLSAANVTANLAFLFGLPDGTDLASPEWLQVIAADNESGEIVQASKDAYVVRITDSVQTDTSVSSP